ncbi:MAG: hypothetical protein IT350_08185 [Deltaproteobacteria bacterium]|nr:hypothetical protein [Deltaproteobacteria bacterium]
MKISTVLLLIGIVFAACSFTGSGTSESDGDSDDSDDDPACVELVGQATDTCFNDLTAVELCSLDDVSCWISCFQYVNTCSDWLACIDAECEIDDVDAGEFDDDDAPPTCEEKLAGEVEECFEGLSAPDVCATDDADCWVGCFEHTNDCSGWADCVESVCINGEDPWWEDLPSADDDSEVSCEDVVLAFVSECPEAEFETAFETVCEVNDDPECLAFCYDAYDDCLDIANCYDTNECWS